MTLPLYLQEKLGSFGINSINDLLQQNYLEVFAWIKDLYPSTSYKCLYDLHCILSNQNLNSLDIIAKKHIQGNYQQILPCYIPLRPEVTYKYLDLANDLAKDAYRNDEIPIGAIVVKDNQVIGSGYNQTKSTNLVGGHAEIIALENAAKYLGTTYLSDCDLYVTIEPCLMCSGAIINSKLKRVVFGAREPKTGAVISQYKVFDNKSFNHHTQAIGPIDTDKYTKILRQFLKSKR